MNSNIDIDCSKLYELLGQKIVGCKSPSIHKEQFGFSSLEFDLTLNFDSSEMNLSCPYNPSSKDFGFWEDNDGNVFYDHTLKVEKAGKDKGHDLSYDSAVESIWVYARKVSTQFTKLSKFKSGMTADFFLLKMKNKTKCYFYFDPYMPQLEVCSNEYHMSTFWSEYGEYYHLVKEIR